jgi:hypothetical protein
MTMTNTLGEGYAQYHPGTDTEPFNRQRLGYTLTLQVYLLSASFQCWWPWPSGVLSKPINLKHGFCISQPPEIHTDPVYGQASILKDLVWTRVVFLNFIKLSLLFRWSLSLVHSYSLMLRIITVKSLCTCLWHSKNWKDLVVTFAY